MWEPRSNAMSTKVRKTAKGLASRNGRLGEPAWEIARFFPSQGEWAEDGYFALDTGNRLVELSDGFLEVLPMPTMTHQWIVFFLMEQLKAFAYPHKEFL